MLKSETIGELAKALAAAQGEIENAKKDAENPFFKSKYADLAAVREAYQKPLSKHGLALVQTPSTEFTEDGMIVSVTTILMHTSGEWVSGQIRAIPGKTDPQGIGSCVTYLRRYGAGAITGVAADDDDGNAASTPTNAREVVTKKSIKSVEITPEVQALRDAIKASMKLLNDAGDTPQWTVERVNHMAKENFNGKTTAQLTAPELNDFADMFSQRLETLRTQKVEVPAKRQAVLAEIRSSAQPDVIDGYLKTHFDGKSLDELTDAELNQVDEEFRIPF